MGDDGEIEEGDWAKGFLVTDRLDLSKYLNMQSDVIRSYGVCERGI